MADNRKKQEKKEVPPLIKKIRQFEHDEEVAMNLQKEEEEDIKKLKKEKKEIPKKRNQSENDNSSKKNSKKEEKTLKKKSKKSKIQDQKIDKKEKREITLTFKVVIQIKNDGEIAVKLQEEDGMEKLVSSTKKLTIKGSKKDKVRNGKEETSDSESESDEETSNSESESDKESLVSEDEPTTDVYVNLARAGDIAGLQRQYNKDSKKNLTCDDEEDFCIAAVKKGNFEVLNWAIEHGMHKFSGYVIEAAIKTGNFKMVKYLADFSEYEEVCGEWLQTPFPKINEYFEARYIDENGCDY